MWPERGEAISRMIDAERCVEQLYAEALRRWSPTLSLSVLPSLTAAGLPPDPDGATDASATSTWQQHAADVVIAGISVLWAAEAIEAMQAFGTPLPPLPSVTDLAVDATVLALVTRAIGHMNRHDVIEAARRVEGDPALRESRNAFLVDQQQHADVIPAIVQAKIEASVRNVTAEPKPDILDVLDRQRTAVEAAITPDSPQFAAVARTAGYQAAGIQNTAIVAAAMQSPETDLHKTWIATIDGKTRPTHFAADGQRTPLASKFTVGTSELDVPGDPAGPPSETRNCRCRVGILAATEVLPDEVDRHTERLDGGDSVQVNRQGSQRDEINRRADQGTVRAREDPEGIGRTAAGAPTQEDDMTITDENVDLADATPSGGDTYRTFTDAVLAFVGIPTSDNRMLASDIDLTFRAMPIPLMWCKQNTQGHDESFTVGVIESASMADGKVTGSGYMLNTPEANEASVQLGHGVTKPSVDLAASDWMMTDEKGNELDEDWWDMPDDVQVYQTVTAAELIGTTLVAKPAFGDTSLALDPERASREPAIVASAAEEFRPKVYDPRLFQDPKLTGPTLPTMGEDGRIYGHLACFGGCHRSVQSECVIAPRSKTDYAHFHTSPAVKLSDGNRIPVGRLTVGTGHASDRVGPGPAMAHYDNTGTCFALVRVGEDAHGIWFSGVAAPWATAEQVQMGISAPLSGDWRDFGAGLELIAALAVNTPGFAARGRDDDQGRPIALVASIGPRPATRSGGPTLSLSDIKAAVREAIVEQTELSSFVAQRDAALAKAAAITRPKTPNERVGELLAAIHPSANDGGLPTQVDVDPIRKAPPQEAQHSGYNGTKQPTRKPSPNTVAPDVTNGKSGTLNAPVPAAKSAPKPGPLTGSPAAGAGTGTPS